jgi:UrcA family protein
MKNLKVRRLVGCGVTLGAMLFALVTNAQGVTEVVVSETQSATPGAELRSKVVNYSDLDISNSAGLSTLMGRIRSAATDVCSPVPQPPNKDIPDSQNFKHCVSHAVSSAVKLVNSPALTAMADRSSH